VRYSTCSNVVSVKVSHRTLKKTQTFRKRSLWKQSAQMLASPEKVCSGTALGKYLQRSCPRTDWCGDTPRAVMLFLQRLLSELSRKRKCFESALCGDQPAQMLALPEKVGSGTALGKCIQRSCPGTDSWDTPRAVMLFLQRFLSELSRKHKCFESALCGNQPARTLALPEKVCSGTALGKYLQRSYPRTDSCEILHVQ